MANISLKSMLEASIDPKLIARSKESGKLVYFKTPQAKDAAMKAGSHEEPKKDKKVQAKQAAQSADMFKGDYSKERDVKTSKSNQYDSNEIGDYLNKMSGGNGLAQMNDNGAIEYNMGDGDMPTYTLYIGDDEQEKGKIAVELSSTYGEDPANLDIYKTFNSKEEAMKYAGELAKKYKKELEMQDSNESTKLTSMIKK